VILIVAIAGAASHNLLHLLTGLIVMWHVKKYCFLIIYFVIVVGDKVLDREPEGSKLVIKTYEQWNILKDNFNIRSLKLCYIATEENSYLQVER
jgi:hypothetical protein